MIPILDIHCHIPDNLKMISRPEAVISCEPSQLPPEGSCEGQRYSVGIHPWDIGNNGLSEQDMGLLRDCAMRKDVVAIGETGIDMTHEGHAPLFAQMSAFKTHVEISETLEKPMILHCVKGHDIIIGLREEMHPKQRWVIHGFRGKPSILQMLLKAGIDVSYGERFNPDSVAATPAENLFAETDESDIPISEILTSLQRLNTAASQDSIAHRTALLFHTDKAILPPDPKE